MAITINYLSAVGPAAIIVTHFDLIMFYEMEENYKEKIIILCLEHDLWGWGERGGKLRIIS